MPPQGPNAGFDALVARAYPALRPLAAMTLREHRDAAALASGPTSVLHEAFLRVAGQTARPSNEEQLRGVTTIVLRRVLLDRRRRREAVKRGGGLAPQALPIAGVSSDDPSPTWLSGGAEMREALRVAALELHRAHPRACEGFLLSTLHGLPQANIAAILAVSVPTVERDIRFARAWIATRIESGPVPPDG